MSEKIKMPTSNSFRKLNDFYLHRSTSKNVYLAGNTIFPKVVDSLKLLLNLCLLKVLGTYTQIVCIGNT